MKLNAPAWEFNFWATSGKLAGLSSIPKMSGGLGSACTYEHPRCARALGSGWVTVTSRPRDTMPRAIGGPLTLVPHGL